MPLTYYYPGRVLSTARCRRGPTRGVAAHMDFGLDLGRLGSHLVKEQGQLRCQAAVVLGAYQQVDHAQEALRGEYDKDISFPVHHRY